MNKISIKKIKLYLPTKIRLKKICLKSKVKAG